MADQFHSHASGLDSPARNAAAVTPNDSTDLANTTRALLLSAAGDVTVDMQGVGSNITLPMQAGYNPVQVTRVYATGTDSLTIVALW
jgi:hypothetical protein